MAPILSVVPAPAPPGFPWAFPAAGILGTVPGSPPPPSDDDVMGLLRGVIDPELGSDIVELGMARSARVDDAGVVLLEIALTTSGCPLRAQIQKDIRSRLETLPGVTRVKINWGELTQDEKSAAMAKARFNVSQDAPDTAVPPTTKVIMIAKKRMKISRDRIG